MALELTHEDAIQQTANMTRDTEAQALAKKHGLDILNVLWEDTARSKGSAYGPNISDVTIQVQDGNKSVCMPVIRFPNFSDKSADISPDKFFVRVGNNKGDELKVVSLKEYLENISEHLSSPDKGTITGNLISDRDTHVLVSAQACFLPVPMKGKAEFTPVIFNYQSSEKNPAVLTILATCQGTSATILDNKRDLCEGGYRSGQKIFQNKKGQKTKMTGERLKDVEEKLNSGIGATDTVVPKAADLVLLIQVPLKYKVARNHGFEGVLYCSAMPAAASMDYSAKGIRTRGISDVDRAVIGHGEEEGEYVELDNLTIERDTSYPIRVTVQFYKATSNGVVDERDLKDIADSIDRVYKEADFVGSLVTEGQTTRPTEPALQKAVGWWRPFWDRNSSRFDVAENVVQERFQKLFGNKWRDFDLDEAERVLRSERLF